MSACEGLPSGPPPISDPLRHHGDAELTGPGEDLLDLAVNVYDGPPPVWLAEALRDSLADVGAYPDARASEAAAAAYHDRPASEALATAGAAEAFTLLARLRPWRRPVVVHPQFTEPHAALVQAGRDVTTVVLDPAGGFALAGAEVPEDADLVVLGNPTNPTGVLHPAEQVLALRRPGRLVVVDEAFMDTVPDEPESLADGVAGREGDSDGDVVVIRSLTKHWSIPGIRAGYLLGPTAVVGELRRQQTPWSVSTPALAAIRACCTEEAWVEAGARADDISEWRALLVEGLGARGVDVVPSAASFVLARVGAGVHAALRAGGVAVRRADTFPGLDDTWVRIAVRPPEVTGRLLTAYDALER